MGAAIAAIGNFVASDGVTATDTYAETLAWTFGLSILSFGIVKIGIAVILMGIIGRISHRVDSLKEALPRLRGSSDTPAVTSGDLKTQWGAATVTANPPGPLPIHRMAKLMWRPMLLMGAMALVTGFIGSLVWAGETAGTESARQAAAFSQGVEFLGEALLLSGIAFLLGTIMADLRAGGGSVQQSLGLPVTTLKMPATAKAFVMLMMAGLMVGIAQFVLYLGLIGNADDPASFAAWSNWLGPFRELSLGLILAGIVLALVTIGNVLAFQFSRVNSIIRAGV